MTIAPIHMRYFKLEVESGCSGCHNEDYVSAISLRLAVVSYREFKQVRARLSTGWVGPTGVVSAECRSTEAPDGTNNEAGINDPGARGGEPEGWCNADESANARAVLEGGATIFRVAIGSGKEYYFIYDLGAHYWVDRFELVGQSHHNWCEDEKKNTGTCHNDNGFKVAFSDSGHHLFNFTAFNPGFTATEHCANLGDGCGWSFPPIKVRYFRLGVVSTCSGCHNYDIVTEIRLRQAFHVTDLIDKLIQFNESTLGSFAAVGDRVGALALNQSAEVA